jgi:hypothetical protein
MVCLMPLLVVSWPLTFAHRGSLSGGDLRTAFGRHSAARRPGATKYGGESCKRYVQCGQLVAVPDHVLFSSAQQFLTS